VTVNDGKLWELVSLNDNRTSQILKKIVQNTKFTLFTKIIKTRKYLQKLSKCYAGRLSFRNFKGQEAQVLTGESPLIK
jgi:hypothetical protein